MTTYDDAAIQYNDASVLFTGGGAVAPLALQIDYDSGTYYNQVYVQGAAPEGSGLFTDHAAVAAANGVVRTGQLHASECRTASLAQALANMYLGHVAGGKPRGTFKITSPYDGWRAGQMVSITDADLGLSADVFRISRVTTRFLRPGSDSKRVYEIEFGGPRAGSFGGGAGGGVGIGQLVRVPFNFGGQALLDSNESADFFVSISERINVIAEAKVWMRFRQFWAPATAAASGGSSTPTTSSGGSQTPTSSSGGSQTPTSGASSASSSGTEEAQLFTEPAGLHNHKALDFSTTAAGGTTRKYTDNNGTGVWINTDAAVDLDTFGVAGHTHAIALGSHSHGIAHTHTVTIVAHTHTVTIAAHDHSVTISPHTHSLTYGMYKETLPASWSVTLTVYERSGSSWSQTGQVTGLTDETEEVDLADYITGAGLWRITLQSAGGQPQGGRLAVDVAGQILGAIASI